MHNIIDRMQNIFKSGKSIIVDTTVPSAHLLNSSLSTASGFGFSFMSVALLHCFGYLLYLVINRAQHLYRFVKPFRKVLCATLNHCSGFVPSLHAATITFIPNLFGEPSFGSGHHEKGYSY